MTGFKSIYMCIVAKRCENITFWDISEKIAVKTFNFLTTETLNTS